MKRGLNIWAILAVACIAGIIGGIVLADRKHETEMREIEAVRESYTATALPMRVPGNYDMMAPDPESLRGLPVYPGSNPRKMVQMNGDELSVSWFYTDDSVSKVVSFYEQAFSNAKLVHFTNYYERNRASVAWMEVDPAKPDAGPRLPDGRLHMVTVLLENGRTLVMPSVTRPDRLIAGAQHTPSWFIAPPGSSTPRVIDVNVENLPRTTAFFEMNEETPNASADVLAGLYSARGWVSGERPVGTDGSTTFVMTKGQKSLTIQLARQTSTNSVMMTLEDKPKELSQ